MRIAVFGAGYVGLVTGACFADLGHEVVVRDVVAEKIDALRRGEVPIHEVGLEDLLERNRQRLAFTLDVGEALESADVVYVAVGTPPTYSGDADLTAVWTVVDELPRVDRRIVLAMKSTVPVGTGRAVRHRLDERGLENVGYVSNPEFTAEGTAVHDFMQPDRIVVGGFEQEDVDAIVRLHAGIDAPVVTCDVPSAEMIKLAANAALVTRISFINEIANVCEATGADVKTVAEGIGLDHRIGPAFLRAGIGYGGSCLVGDETVVVRAGSATRLVSLETLYDESESGRDVEILTWSREEGSRFCSIELLTRRAFAGEVVEVETGMGRRVVCTPDHPFVTPRGRVLAEELTPADLLPIALGAPPPARRLQRLRVHAAVEPHEAGPVPVIVRPQRGATATLDRSGLRAVAVGRPNGTHAPESIDSTEAFWRVVGLYLAVGDCSVDGPDGRMRWSFRPTGEAELVEEISEYWTSLGVRTTVDATATSMRVSIRSRLLAHWWIDVLGMGCSSHELRLPDRIWDETEANKRALLSGAFRGDGSWPLVSGGPDVLEHATVSRELADGILRLLGELEIVARLSVGRASGSTREVYRIVVSRAGQAEELLDPVSEDVRSAIRVSNGLQATQVAPAGYRRSDSSAWVRVVRVVRRPFEGYVYSLEVPPVHTFVTTGGLVTSNCFPKDSLALKQLAANSGYNFQLLNAVIEVNELQKRRVIRKLERRLGPLRGRKVALLGLAFKPGTDDMREAPSLVLAARLLAEGAHVSAWDPVANGALHLDGVDVATSALDALDGADAAVIVTEWPELAELDWAAAGSRMKRRVLVDGRNLLDPATLRAAGFEYEGIGRAVE